MEFSFVSCISHLKTDQIFSFLLQISHNLVLSFLFLLVTVVHATFGQQQEILAPSNKTIIIPEKVKFSVDEAASQNNNNKHSFQQEENPNVLVTVVPGFQEDSWQQQLSFVPNSRNQNVPSHPENENENVQSEAKSHNKETLLEHEPMKEIPLKLEVVQYDDEYYEIGDDEYQEYLYPDYEYEYADDLDYNDLGNMVLPSLRNRLKASGMYKEFEEIEDENVSKLEEDQVEMLPVPSALSSAETSSGEKVKENAGDERVFGQNFKFITNGKKTEVLIFNELHQCVKYGGITLSMRKIIQVTAALLSKSVNITFMCIYSFC